MDILTLTLAVQKTLRELGVDAKTEKTVFLPETTVQYNNNDGTLVASTSSLVPGKTYSVLWDGNSYPCVCGEVTVEGNLYRYLGNLVIWGFEDTGEPFAVIEMLGEGLNIGPVADENDHTIAIYQESTTTTPINKDLLPGVCLPVVEFCALDVETSTFTISSSDQVILDKAADGGIPVILKCTVGDLNISAVASYLETSDEIGFGAEIPNVGFILSANKSKTDGAIWEGLFKNE